VQKGCSHSYCWQAASVCLLQNHISAQVLHMNTVTYIFPQNYTHYSSKFIGTGSITGNKKHLNMGWITFHTRCIYKQETFTKCLPLFLQTYLCIIIPCHLYIHDRVQDQKKKNPASVIVITSNYTTVTTEIPQLQAKQPSLSLIIRSNKLYHAITSHC